MTEDLEIEGAEVASEVAAIVVLHQIRVIEDDVIFATMEGGILSEGYIQVERDVYDAATLAITGGHGAWYRDGAVVLMPAPPPPPITISAETLFFDRMTNDEYDALDASVRAGETARVY